MHFYSGKVKRRGIHPHAGATQLLSDISPDVFDGHWLQLLIALDLLIDGSFAGPQFPAGVRRGHGYSLSCCNSLNRTVTKSWSLTWGHRWLWLAHSVLGCQRPFLWTSSHEHQLSGFLTPWAFWGQPPPVAPKQETKHTWKHTDVVKLIDNCDKLSDHQIVQ